MWTRSLGNLHSLCHLHDILMKVAPNQSQSRASYHLYFLMCILSLRDVWQLLSSPSQLMKCRIYRLGTGYPGLSFISFAQVKFSSARKLVTRVADTSCDSWRRLPLRVSPRASLLSLLPSQYNGRTSLPRNNTFVYHESFISLATVKS